MNEWVGEWEESRVTLKERAQNGFSFPEFSLSSTETGHQFPTWPPKGASALFSPFILSPALGFSGCRESHSNFGENSIHFLSSRLTDIGMGLKILLITQVAEDVSLAEVVSFSISWTNHPVEFFELNTALDGRVALSCKTVLQVVKIIFLIIPLMYKMWFIYNHCFNVLFLPQEKKW